MTSAFFHLIAPATAEVTCDVVRTQPSSASWPSEPCTVRSVESVVAAIPARLAATTQSMKRAVSDSRGSNPVLASVAELLTCSPLGWLAGTASDRSELLDVDAERHGADRRAAGRIADGEADLRLQRLGRFVLLDLVDEDRVGAGAERLLELGFVALPVVGGGIALADV